MKTSKIIALSLLFSFLSSHLLAQGINLLWDSTVGDGYFYEARGHAITVDSFENVITVGVFTDSLDINPGPSSQWLITSGQDIFIQKLDSSGNFMWGKQIGGTAFEEINTVRVDKMGNVYCAGAFGGTVDFDPGSGVTNLTSAGNFDYFVLKLTPNGDFIWAKRIGGPFLDEAFALAIDATGCPIITGGFWGQVDVDPGPAVQTMGSAGNRAMLVQKLDTLGNFLWAKAIHGSQGAAVSDDITLNAAREIYVCGSFQGMVDFDPDTSQSLLSFGGMRNLFVQKLDSVGNLIWADGIGGAGRHVEATGIVVDAHDQVAICGNLSVGTDSIDFDPGLGYYPIAPYDPYPSSPSFFGAAFIMKWDSLRNLSWLRQLIGSGLDGDGGTATIDEIAIDTCGAVYGIGHSDNGPLLGPAKSTHDLSDPLIIMKFDANGNSKWLGGWGTGLPNFGHGIAVSPSGDVLITGKSLEEGYYSYTAGEFRALIQKYEQIPGVFANQLTVSACYSYTSPTGQVYTSSGNYVEVVNECLDMTTYTIDLTINSASSEMLVDMTCDSSYVLNNETYTNSGIYTQLLENAAGCDSTLTLDLTIASASEETFMETICFGDSFVLNNQSYTTEGIYTQHLSNTLGCDSTLTLDLTVLPAIDTAISQFGHTLITTQPNASYQWLDCNANFAPIPGANLQTFIPSQNGTYATIISLMDCIDTSDCYLITTIGIDLDLASSIQYYPNPSAGSLTIEFGQQYQDIEIEVWNVVGQKISTATFQTEEQVQAILPEETGMYLIHVIADERRAVLKVMRE